MTDPRGRHRFWSEIYPKGTLVKFVNGIDDEALRVRRLDDKDDKVPYYVENIGIILSDPRVVDGVFGSFIRITIESQGELLSYVVCKTNTTCDKIKI